MFGALSGVVHVDGKGSRLGQYLLPAGDTISEPVFVARGDDAAEGDGWLLAAVWRARENRSDLAVFNATDVEAGPVALVQLGHRVPDGFHGNWVGGGVRPARSILVIPRRAGAARNSYIPAMRSGFAQAPGMHGRA